MSSPKIGRAYEKASNALAYQARKLREEVHAVEDHGTVLARLRRIGDEMANEQRQEKQAIADQQIAELQPLIEKAREYLAETAEARAEAKPILQSFFAVKWEAIHAKLSPDHGRTRGNDQYTETLNEDGEPVVANYGVRFSTDSTRLKIARLYAAAEELKKIVDSKDDDMTAALQEVQRLTEVRSSQSLYMINWLRQCVGYGPVAESIRGKLAGVKKLLSEIGEDVLALGQEAK